MIRDFFIADFHLGTTMTRSEPGKKEIELFNFDARAAYVACAALC